MIDYNQKLVRIGIFYDGNYFSHVSNYYNYEHERKARLSVSGIHEFIRHQVAQLENTDVRYCQIVDSHYFRGRLNSFDANEQNRLLSERVFEDILMNEGVVTHYMPLKVVDGRREEKGIDVWLALEAYELTIFKHFNVIVLIASDSDYIPLVRKLNSLGTRVMLLGWDFEYTDERTGKIKRTTTSLSLLEEVSYPILMHEIIDNKVNKNQNIIRELFVNKDSNLSQNSFAHSSTQHNTFAFPSTSSSGRSNRSPKNLISVSEEVKQSRVFSIKNGYGFITFPPNNLFFHWSSTVDCDFSELREGDWVEFKTAKSEPDKEDDVAVEVRRIEKPKYFDEVSTNGKTDEPLATY
jgi:uncharacterized LabA/DUF88 family protein/cold shock CspA family protein